jgi:hypothetical protein
MALILSSTVFVKINLPRPAPDLSVFKELIKTLNPQERRLAADNARAIADYAGALEQALAGE